MLIVLIIATYNVSILNLAFYFYQMFGQKRKEQIKAYEKQEKRIRELKATGSSKKQAVSVI